MYLSEISAHGLKGRNFSHKLAQLTAIVGPNFSGKTAVVEAIRLLFLSYLPELGKTAKATFQLANGESMSISGKLGDEAIARQWRQTSDGAVKLTGTEEMWSIPLLDSEHYFGLSDKERTAYVFANAKLPESASAKSILVQLHQVSFGEEHTEQHEQAKTKNILSLQPFFSHPTATIQGALEASGGWLKEQFTVWNRRQKDTISAVRVITELKLREDEEGLYPARLVDVESEIAESRAEYGKLSEKIGEVTGLTREYDRIYTGLKRARAELDNLPLKGKSDLKALQALVDTAPDANAYHEAELHSARCVSQHAGKQSELAAAVREEAAQEKNIKDLRGMKSCPYCKSVGEDWKNTLKTTFTQKRDAAKADKERLTPLVEKAATARDEARKTIDLLRQTAAAAEEAKETLGVIKTVEERRTKLTAQIKELEKELPNERPDAGAIEAERQGIAVKGKELAAVADKIKTLQQDKQRAAQAEIEHLNAKAQMEVVKAFQAVIETTKEKLVDETFEALLRTANCLCDEVLLSPLAFHEGEVGRWDGALWISHRTFSGTEKAVTYLAISAALSANALVKLAILDEFGRLDRDNQGVVLCNLKNMVTEGVLDQAIVVGVGFEDSFLPPCKVIRMEEPE